MDSIALVRKELRKRYAPLVGTIAAVVARSNADLLELIARDYDLDYAELVTRYGIAASSVKASAMLPTPIIFPAFNNNK